MFNIIEHKIFYENNQLIDRSVSKNVVHTIENVQIST